VFVGVMQVLNVHMHVAYVFQIVKYILLKSHTKSLVFIISSEREWTSYGAGIYRELTVNILELN
jgi:hypothetical protein